MTQEEIVVLVAILGGGALAILLTCLFFGIVCRLICKNKGYEKGGFAWGFFLGLIGLIVCCCKPNLNFIKRQQAIQPTGGVQPAAQPAPQPVQQPAPQPVPPVVQQPAPQPVRPQPVVQQVPDTKPENWFEPVQEYKPSQPQPVQEYRPSQAYEPPKPVNEYKQMTPAAAPQAAGWVCSCNARNGADVKFCPNCGKSRRGGESRDLKCPYCGAINRSERTECVQCKRPLEKPVEQEPAKAEEPVKAAEPVKAVEPVAAAPVVEMPVVETPVAEAPAAEEPVVENISAVVEMAMPEAPAEPVAEAEDQSKDVELLAKLAELHAQGILSDEEFQKKKMEILSKM